MDDAPKQDRMAVSAGPAYSPSSRNWRPSAHPPRSSAASSDCVISIRCAENETSAADSGASLLDTANAIERKSSGSRRSLRLGHSPRRIQSRSRSAKRRPQAAVREMKKVLFLLGWLGLRTRTYRSWVHPFDRDKTQTLSPDDDGHDTCIPARPMRLANYDAFPFAGFLPFEIFPWISLQASQFSERLRSRSRAPACAHAPCETRMNTLPRITRALMTFIRSPGCGGLSSSFSDHVTYKSYRLTKCKFKLVPGWKRSGQATRL